MPSGLEIEPLRGAFAHSADPARAEQMAAYMMGHFVYFGLASSARRAAAAATAAAAKQASADEIVEFVRRCWDQPQREFHSTGTDILGWNVAKLEPRHLGDLEYFVSTNSWWDTVDALASWSVGGLVRSHPELTSVMDEWIDSDDMWIARTAILHQLRYKDATDTERLFRFALRRAGDTEFFIRKAIGWALRQYAHTDPDAIRAFVEANEDRFSGLTKREALKNIR